MVKLRQKTAFKKSLRDAKGPDSKNPYVAPQKPDSYLFEKAEDACKELASHDEGARDQALADLRIYLGRVEEDAGKTIDVAVEFAKLWNGLFYCMWHSDKPLVQLDCANRIADLVLSLKSWQLRSEWLNQGWQRLHSQWGMIDKWRVNKYYSLMRFVFNRQLVAMQEAAEQLGDSEETDVMVDTFCQPLLEAYNVGLSGVGTHVSDVMIEECAAVGFPAEDFVSLFIQLVLPVLVCGDHYQCEHIYEQVWTKLLGGYAEEDEVVDWIADIPFEVLLEALQHAMVDKSTTDKNRGLLVKMADELEEFLQKAADEEDEELVEIDSDEEAAEVQAEVRRVTDLKARENADTETKKRKDIKVRRTVEKKIKKAVEKGDDKAVKSAVGEAKKLGVKLPQMKKKKKGKGNLKTIIAPDGTLAKAKVKRHRKRRI